MAKWEMTGKRSLRIECDCGMIHEVKSDAEGKFEIQHFKGKRSNPGHQQSTTSEPQPKKSSKWDPFEDD